MRAFLFAMVLSVAACSCATMPDLPTPTELEQAVVSIGDSTRNWCTGVAVGEHTILTASHCLPPMVDHLWIDGEKTNIMVLAEDGYDHALVSTEKQHLKVLPVVRNHEHELGEDVGIVGYPGGYGPFYRKGTYSGPITHPQYGKTHAYDLAGTGGDSGAPLLNNEGEVIATISEKFAPRPGFQLLVTINYRFTDEQWEMIN